MVFYFFHVLFSYDRLAPFLISIQYQSCDHYGAYYPVWIQFTNINPIHKRGPLQKNYCLSTYEWPTHIFAEMPKSAIFVSLACVYTLTSQLPIAWLPINLRSRSRAGSNNTNLLVPSGQFGTRLQGGKVPVTQRWWWSSGIDLGIQEENLKMGKDKYVYI